MRWMPDSLLLHQKQVLSGVRLLAFASRSRRTFAITKYASASSRCRSACRTRGDRRELRTFHYAPVDHECVTRRLDIDRTAANAKIISRLDINRCHQIGTVPFPTKRRAQLRDGPDNCGGSTSEGPVFAKSWDRLFGLVLDAAMVTKLGVDLGASPDLSVRPWWRRDCGRRPIDLALLNRPKAAVCVYRVVSSRYAKR